MDTKTRLTDHDEDKDEAGKTIVSKDGTRTITLAEFDRLFDEGSDEIDDFIDWSNAKLVEPLIKPKRVNVDFTPHMVNQLDAEARRRGVSRQALIKMWIADKLEERNK